MRRLKRILIALACLAVPAQFSRQAVAQAAAQPAAPTTALAASGVYLVNSTADTPDADTGNPACADAAGHCTLRAAIMQADFATDPNTITVPAGVYLLTRPGEDDNAVVGDLDITHDLDIEGAGAGQAVVDGNGSVTGQRVFDVRASAIHTMLSNLTIRGGQALSGTFDSGGGLAWQAGSESSLHLNHLIIENNKASYAGGIQVGFSSGESSAILEDVTVRHNSATAAGGGLSIGLAGFTDDFELRDSHVFSNTAYEGAGLAMAGGPMDPSPILIENTEIYSNTGGLSAGIDSFLSGYGSPLVLAGDKLHDNQASIGGGAIGTHASLVLSQTTIANNSAGLWGGGVYNYQSGLVNVSQSTFSGNSAQIGGGFYAEFFGGGVHPASFLTVTNSTFSHNLASQDGAGLYLNSGHSNFYNATIADNSIVQTSGTSPMGVGGGLYISATVQVAARGTLIAGNTHRYTLAAAQPDDCYGPLDSLGWNMLQSSANCAIYDDMLDNFLGYNPLLGPLTYNGGPTETQALSAHSPAIDEDQPGDPGCIGPLSAPVTVDQRGFPRPHGPHCDIGAVEYYPSGPYLPIVRR